MTTGKNKNVVELVNAPKKPTGKKTGSTGGSGGGKPDKTQRFGDYLVKDGAFHQVKAVRSGGDGEGMIEFALCDFVCKIVEEIQADDGLNDATFLRMEGRRRDGVALPVVDVPAKRFYSIQGNWANEHWGTLPFIYPGAAKKDTNAPVFICIHG